MSGPGVASPLPIAAMVGLTAVVGVALLAQRRSEMHERRIRPQAVANSRLVATVLERVNSADNLRNLFEAPALFCALCLALSVTQSAAPAMLAAAWVYVLLRALHSAIHCSYKRVTHRLAAFAASFGLLVGMWAVFPWQLAGQL